MGQQIGLAVLNAIRFQRARYEATLEERERLAREMHDSLAQALGYLKMKASMTDELLSGGQIDEAQVNLREVKEIAGETYFDVRETIFGLRNTSAKGSQFLPGLEEYLDKYRLHYGLQVHLAAEENCRPTFSPETSIQLTRIIQEALTNVRKHADSTEATIRFARSDHHWRITVEDQGAGFDSRTTQTEGWRFLGLHIMQERAEGIGAELAVDSQPGCGTRVMIRVPFESEA
jgi:signal transduction histidine kinase